MFLPKWILNLQDLPQSQNLETVPICIAWQYYPQNCFYLHVFPCMISNEKIFLSQAFVHFVIDRASLFEYQVSQFLPNINFRTIWDQTCDNSPADFNSSSLKWWSSMHGVVTLSCWVVLFDNSQYRFKLLGMTLYIVRQRRNTKILGVWKFWSSLRWLCICRQYLCL